MMALPSGSLALAGFDLGTIDAGDLAGLQPHRAPPEVLDADQGIADEFLHQRPLLEAVVQVEGAGGGAGTASGPVGS